MHRDHVPNIPDGYILLGSTSIAGNQGMIKRYSTSSPQWDAGQTQVFTVQGHPEFSPDIVNLVINAREKSGVMDAQTVRESRAKANKRDDGVGPIGRAVFRVLGITS